MRSLLVKGTARRWVVAVLGVALIASVVATFALSLGRRPTAHASGGPGPLCQPLSDGTPSCHIQGFSTFLGVNKVDTSTCPTGVYTTIEIFVNEAVVHQGGTASSPDVFAFVFSWNSCTYTFTQDYGETTTPDLQVRGQIEGATLHAAFPTISFYGAIPGPTLTVDATWTGFGSVTAATDSKDIRSGDYLYRARETADSRLATLSGSISDGTTTYPLSGVSEILTIQQGTLMIVHV